MKIYFFLSCYSLLSILKPSGKQATVGFNWHVGESGGQIKHNLFTFKKGSHFFCFTDMVAFI